MIPDIKLPPNWRQNEDHFTVTEEEYGGTQHAFNNQDYQAMYALPGSQSWISLMSSLRASIYVEEGFDQTGPFLLHWSLKEVVMAYPDPTCEKDGVHGYECVIHGAILRGILRMDVEVLVLWGIHAIVFYKISRDHIIQ
jgi:hypothetical protein